MQRGHGSCCRLEPQSSSGVLCILYYNALLSDYAIPGYGAVIAAIVILGLLPVSQNDRLD